MRRTARAAVVTFLIFVAAGPLFDHTRPLLPTESQAQLPHPPPSTPQFHEHAFFRGAAASTVRFNRTSSAFSLGVLLVEFRCDRRVKKLNDRDIIEITYLTYFQVGPLLSHASRLLPTCPFTLFHARHNADFLVKLLKVLHMPTPHFNSSF